MTRTIELRIDPETAATETLLRAVCAKTLCLNIERIPRIDILRRSIDARQRRVMVNLKVLVHIDTVDTTAAFEPVHYSTLPDNAPDAIVVGAGPAGLFAALELIELGIKPIILERGKDVDARRRDMVAINRNGTVDPDSNYCFGEGGAGAYSDGKLYTRSTKRGPVDKVLRIFHQHGAQHDILVDAHPHIGTDKLPGVIKAMRETILRCGGEVRFCTRVQKLLFGEECGRRQVKGVVSHDGREWHGCVILATGHSARDVYSMLMAANCRIEPKGIAVGVRLEHPQQLIDCLQYHSTQGRGPYLPPAEYSLLTRVDNRAVYSFCMCPGGYIIPAASAPGQLVVNGMSPASRGTQWANSGMVVEILPEDVATLPGRPEALKMMLFQQQIESAFFTAAGGTQKAPAQRMTDFVAGTTSATLPRSSYPPGLLSLRVDKLLPADVSRRLRTAFRIFDTKQPGFLSKEAVVIGDETRTSSPMRIPRDAVSMHHIDIPGLYPCGEGAGYAGGIVSAALDGIRTAHAVAATYNR